jgi:hypothetical protein
MVVPQGLFWSFKVLLHLHLHFVRMVFALLQGFSVLTPSFYMPTTSQPNRRLNSSLVRECEIPGTLCPARLLLC